MAFSRAFDSLYFRGLEKGKRQRECWEGAAVDPAVFAIQLSILNRMMFLAGFAELGSGTFPITAFERSRWRGGRFACYAPHVMPQHSASHCGSRACSFSKYCKTNSLQVSEKIEFP
jgi:hypothetical protein